MPRLLQSDRIHVRLVTSNICTHLRITSTIVNCIKKIVKIIKMLKNRQFCLLLKRLISLSDDLSLALKSSSDFSELGLEFLAPLVFEILMMENR